MAATNDGSEEERGKKKTTKTKEEINEKEQEVEREG